LTTNAGGRGRTATDANHYEKVECARSPRQQNDAIRGNRPSRLRRSIPGQGADGGSRLVPVSRGVRPAYAPHSAPTYAIPAVSAYRAPDQLAFAPRPALARRGALSTLSRNRIRAGIARLSGRPRHLAMRDVSAGDRAVQLFRIRLDGARRG